MDNQNIFLTGSTGFVGRHFIQMLSQRIGSSDRIFALVRSQPEQPLDRVEYLLGDLLDIERYRSQIQSCKIVFHLAANATFGDSADYDKDNVQPIRTLIELLKDSEKLSRFVLISTIGAVDRAPDDRCSRPLNENSVPHPRSAYGRSKLQAECILRESGIPWTIIRPAWVWGKGMRANSHLYRFVTFAVQRKVTLFSFDFPGRVSLIHVDDLCLGLCSLLNTSLGENRIYFAATEDISIGTLLSKVWRNVHGQVCWQIPFLGLMNWIRYMHSLLPLSLSNLFVDYLFCDARPFNSELLSTAIKPIDQYLSDVVHDHASVNGIVVVTGAAGGIGLATTKSLIERQIRVLAVDKNPFPADLLTKCQSLQMNLCDESSADQIRAAVGFNRLRALVNNAGVGFKGSFSEVGWEKHRTTFDLNVLAPQRLAYVFSKKLERDRGVLVNVASSVAYNSLPGMATYAASKAALLSWSEALSQEWRGKIDVVTISPSGTRTQFQSKAGVLQGEGSLMSAEEVGERIACAAVSPSGHLILGMRSKIMIGLTRCLPVRLAAFIWGKLFEQLR